MSRDECCHQKAEHALSRGRRYQVSKWNSLAATAKWSVIFILATREGIDFRGVGMAVSHCLLFMLATVLDNYVTT